jgi:glycosyltransferase involved in cell wall biosynthesis
MLLSVIIPTFNRLDLLQTCLDRLTPELQKVSTDDFEVIVTDDASGDKSSSKVASPDRPWIRHVNGPQKGPAANRNNGAKAGKGDWLIFLDDDCIPDSTFLSAYIEAIKLNANYQVFEGSTLAERPRARLDEEAPINEKGGYLWSCNFMVKRSLYFELGGFCELYPYACMEDVDFCRQLRTRNIEFLFVPKASVIHPWRGMSPDDRYLKVLLVSHAIFYERYPMMRPRLYVACRNIFAQWVQGLFVFAPRLKFRGFGRYLKRQMTVTVFQILTSTGFNPKQS